MKFYIYDYAKSKNISIYSKFKQKYLIAYIIDTDENVSFAHR